MGINDSERGQSEAPSIKNPHKARRGGTSSMQHHPTLGRVHVIGTTKRKGSRVLGFVTHEASTRAEGTTGQTSAKGDGAAEGTEDGTTPSSTRSEQTAIRMKRKSGAFSRG